MELQNAKTGRITAYGFACGYIERHESCGVAVTLWKEHGTYHVRAHGGNIGRIFWDSFPNLAAARKRYELAKQSLFGEE